MDVANAMVANDLNAMCGNQLFFDVGPVLIGRVEVWINFSIWSLREG